MMPNPMTVQTARHLLANVEHEAARSGCAGIRSTASRLSRDLERSVKSAVMSVDSVVEVLNCVTRLEDYRLATDVPPTCKETLDEVSLALSDVVRECLEIAAHELAKEGGR